ncbi:pentapeptide repeat-containing protein [Micromonospora sp. KC207]|uniref:pentapeptide repeat-containing protein n=1 Tax=Micromonospora sp. KC207 TaxID=2530377 RepID=UPI001A9FCCDC|nr:pentapeptide repeat-containing protein [Micromonospora sp. KC207]
MLLLTGMLVLLLGPIAWWATPAKHLQGKDKADVRNATRQTLLAAVGGLVVLSGAAFTARTFYLTRRGQLTDRYTKAIGQLASDRLTERLGGIYALEHLMAESDQDHNTVVEVLAAFIRESASLEPAALTATGPGGAENTFSREGRQGPPTDVQAALTVLSRRPERPERNPINLTRTDLKGGVLLGVKLQGANLKQARLEGAILDGAQLQGANLKEARLQGASMRWAQLQGANLTRAWLQGAGLLAAQFEGACLFETQLQGAVLEGAWLEDAILLGAKLRDANLIGALLTDADRAAAWSQGAYVDEIR